MRTPSRALSLEPVEDRSLPSAFVFVQPTYSYRSHGDDNLFAPASQGRGWQARTFQAESFIRVRFADDSVLFIRETPTGFQLIPVTVGSSYSPPVQVPNPVVGPTAGGETSSTGGSAQGGDGGGASNSAAASHGPVRSAAAPTGVGEVAIAPTTQPNTPVQPTNADQAAAASAAAAQAATQNSPQAVAQATTPTAGGHAAYAITAIVPEEEGTGASPQTDPTPMPGPAPRTVADTGSDSGVIELAAAAVVPVAGVLPLDLSTLQVGAGQFLDRVADLAPTWPDSMPAFTDTLWVAAGVLLTGGAAYAFSARSAPRPARDPLTGALSEWERRNGRATG